MAEKSNSPEIEVKQTDGKGTFKRYTAYVQLIKSQMDKKKEAAKHGV